MFLEEFTKQKNSVTQYSVGGYTFPRAEARSPKTDAEPRPVSYWNSHYHRDWGD